MGADFMHKDDLRCLGADQTCHNQALVHQLRAGDDLAQLRAVLEV